MQHLSNRLRHCLAVPLFLLLWLLCPIQPSVAGNQPPPDPVEQAINALYRDIRTETLANGLRVYLKPIAGAPTVSTMLAYQVGSADEELDQTGLSHYLEHLLFKGTDKLMPGDIDRITQRHGGRNNAYTSEDMTVYHFDFAAEVWEQALFIEADRMRNTRIDEKHEFAIEKGNVISELEGNEDTPWDLEYKALLPLVFGKDAPYGHPVIGIREHVRDATAAVIQKHYDRWYHPNNAALVVVGGFDADRALARIRELFRPDPRPETTRTQNRPTRLSQAADQAGDTVALRGAAYGDGLQHRQADRPGVPRLRGHRASLGRWPDQPVVPRVG
jgi:zinc protease